jgi:circadian clock protein KaiC
LRGSSTLVSGSPGTSKTILGAVFAASACARGEHALLVSFDESGAQIIANMHSIGVDLAQFIDAGLLSIASFLSTGCSPEEHFVEIRNLLNAGRPDCLVIDPISALLKADYAFSAMICENLLDLAKSRGITVLCTSLMGQATGSTELSASQVSTIADTWLHVSYIARDGERNRALTIIKSRGTGHSNQVRELVLSDSGVDLVDVYLAEGEVLMGSARAQKEADDRRVEVLARLAFERQHLELERELSEARARVQVAALELDWKQREADLLDAAEQSRTEVGTRAAIERLHLRRADAGSAPGEIADAPTGAERS